MPPLIDPTTVRFGPNGSEAAPVQSALEDVDGDGDTDMILHFKTQDTGIVCGDTSASLTGETFGGEAIGGSDSIKTVDVRRPDSRALCDRNRKLMAATWSYYMLKTEGKGTGIENSI